MANMISCMIVDNDKYQTLGMVAIVKKIFTSLGFKKEIKFYRKAFYSADIIFIGVDEFSFFDALKRLDKAPSEADVFLICDARLNSFLQGIPRFSNVTMIFREDGVDTVTNKITTVFKRKLRGLKDNLSERKSTRVLSLPSSERQYLTPNENIVLKLFNEGFSGGDIAKILKKSEKTVSGQKRSAMKKLGARTDVELIKMFMFK
ncbi:LuxR family transcriptional regulator [Yersinia enterocolitica]|uniref:LuxR-family regulatory proteins n=2 Tax=Yersinia enterocolitica TaxID=630 RepID=A1JPL1_YERE8|nr:LuxR family transcriptional regulator [Yersinia enterocolitica]PNM16628.1 LuxR family transcriptional regulator [Yersinia enterocolitica]PNM17837.1 LuxR family transcriptional regulator [Yersinia enterocolitica]RLZ00738.1 LuxR family transcriptional regulator [Yersinia enterocolitica]CAL13053.1 putative LuxR-family regulatory proteins [Yersinia enterocolitica subsp. enterocolitica 8081]